MSATWPSAATLDSLVDTLSARPPRLGTTRLLAIDGRSGAGKSTLARALAPRLDAVVVEMELIYPGWDGLEQGLDIVVEQVLEPLAAGRPAEVPTWDYARGTWGTPTRVPVPQRLILEGVGTGDRRIAQYASLVVWVDLDDVVREQRAMQRDGDTYRPHWTRWADQERALLSRERIPGRADVVLSSA